MTTSYENALNDAEQALAELDAKANEIELDRAKVKQIIAVLKHQLGLSPDNATSLTDAILLVLKAWPGYATAIEVMERLFIMGYNAQTASVRSILSRLSRERKINAYGDDMRRTVGYGWRTDLTKAERLTAQKELASGSPNKKPIILRPRE